ncbi:MAG TPA: leucyl aminopeptidase [Propionibacteriaceae bacterium]|nr:leucyl aminopeptidase [Micropruina sp.]HBX80354.1 leucyl aminopeptidase [Propionibacteriaceae bacterium]HBY22471.1 leucyl aminopeptidase [Propionibacteriaceae bacterium]
MQSQVGITLAKSVGQTDVLVIGLAETSSAEILVGAPDELERAHRKPGLLFLAKTIGAKSTPGTTVLLPLPDGTLLVVTGLGGVDVTPEQVRRAAGNGVRAAAKVGGDRPLNVTVSLDVLEPELIKATVEGAVLGAYTYGKVTGQPSKGGVGQLTIVTSATGSDARQALEQATAIGKAVCLAREWINTPANLLYPASFAEDARVVARDAKITVEVLDEKVLEKEGFGGILAVGGGSSRKPRLVRYSYAPRGARFHLALVGKGITFDSGGLDLKTAEGMYTMKCDMSGAAAVLAATKAIADLGLRVKVTTYAALAENLPSGEAYRPSDVLTMYGGKTVENYNSDAEGRLVLADALARATQDAPDMIIDVATLTGACMIALGLRTAGLMASDDQTADHILDAAEAAGEALWQLPIPEHLRKVLDSKVADIRSGGQRYGGALVAATFLHEFVPEGTPWAHLDIAGPAFNEEEAYDYVPSGGTGFGVRTLVALAQFLAS